MRTVSMQLSVSCLHCNDGYFDVSLEQNVDGEISIQTESECSSCMGHNNPLGAYTSGLVALSALIHEMSAQGKAVITHEEEKQKA